MKFSALTADQKKALELLHHHKDNGRIRDHIKALLLIYNASHVLHEATVHQRLTDWTSWGASIKLTVILLGALSISKRLWQVMNKHVSNNVCCTSTKHFRNKINQPIDLTISLIPFFAL